MVAHHLSKLEAEKGIEDPKNIDEFFPNEQLLLCLDTWTL